MARERGVSVNRIAELCAQAGLNDRLQAFEKGAEKGATSLLAAFYFRQAKRAGGDRTFEFTHKSFGEYLTARRLVSAIEGIDAERMRNRQNRKLGWDIEAALIEWVRLTGPTALDRDLVAFVAREIALKQEDAAAVESWHSTIVELINDQLRNGLPMTKVGLDTYKEMTRQARNAEAALIAARSTCVRQLNRRENRQRVLSDIDWPSGFGLRDLLGRLMQGETYAQQSLYLGWISARGQLLSWEKLIGAELEGADLQDCELSSALLFAADLDGADLRNSRLPEANLRWCWMRGTRLGGAHLSRASLDDAKLGCADLRGASLVMASLERASLTGANFTGANLEGANLQGAQLEGANLKDASSLQGVKIDRKWLKRCGIDPQRLRHTQEPMAHDEED